MKKSLRRKDVHLSDTKVIVNVLISRIEVNFRKAYRISSIFVDLGVQRSEIYIRNFFSLSGFGIQGCGAGSSAKEGISWLER